jgi:hypothetical protein
MMCFPVFGKKRDRQDSLGRDILRMGESSNVFQRMISPPEEVPKRPW